MKTILTLSTIVLILRTTGFARDPYQVDLPTYGEAETVGGEGWTAGDTFIVIALPLAIIATIALPLIFDGPDEEDFEPLTFSSSSAPHRRMAMFGCSFGALGSIVPEQRRDHAYGDAWFDVWPVSPGLVSSADTGAKFPTRSTCIDTF